MDNKAVWLNGPGTVPLVGPAPVPKPGEGQLLIRVCSVRDYWPLLVKLH